MTTTRIDPRRMTPAMIAHLMLERYRDDATAAAAYLRQRARMAGAAHYGRRWAAALAIVEGR